MPASGVENAGDSTKKSGCDLTLASRVRSYLLIDLLLLEWKRREEKHQA